MKGHILSYSVQTNSGVISGDDNQRYSFSGADWMESEPPRRGMQVDFTPSDGRATQIYEDAAAGSLPIQSSTEGNTAPGFGVRCMQCGSNVIPNKPINWLLFIVFLLLCCPAAIIYLLVQSGKEPTCPVCGSSRFENQNA